jgi:hypothetical protein
MNAFKQGTRVRNFIGGLAMICIAASPLHAGDRHAGELPAGAGETIDLGRFHGVVYYTSEDDGYRVVATIADGEAGLPMRFSVTLADNQSATISVPNVFGEPGYSLKISRSGDTLTLTDRGRASGTY